MATNRSWNRIHSRFVGAGFSEGEAVWAAEQRLDLRSSLIQAILRARASFVEDFPGAFPGKTREDAIRVATEQVRNRNARYGLTGFDLNNIFRELSP